jgi:hypothetical protein
MVVGMLADQSEQQLVEGLLGGHGEAAFEAIVHCRGRWLSAYTGRSGGDVHLPCQGRRTNRRSDATHVCDEVEDRCRLADLSLILGGTLVYQTWALDTPNRSKPRAPEVKKTAAGISADQVARWRAFGK